MPMDFPNLQSLERVAEYWSFRPRRYDETEDEYRRALADFVEPRDMIESMEIRTGKGWDQFTTEDNRQLIKRSIRREGK